MKRLFLLVSAIAFGQVQREPVSGNLYQDQINVLPGMGVHSSGHFLPLIVDADGVLQTTTTSSPYAPISTQYPVPSAGAVYIDPGDGGKYRGAPLVGLTQDGDFVALAVDGDGKVIVSGGGGGGGISSINGDTSAAQVIAVGTSGTDVAIANSGATHTINIPSASASNRGALTTTDWSAFNAKVATTRSISTTAPLAGGGDLSANRTFTCNVASGSQPGCLASADWTTFNGKQAAGSYITGLTGEVVASGPGSVAATIANNAITAAKIASGTITNVKFAVMAAKTVKANVTSGANFPTDTTISAFSNELPLFSSAIQGMVPPAPGGSPTYFVDGSANWRPIPGAVIGSIVDNSPGSAVPYIDGGNALQADPTNFRWDPGTLSLVLSAISSPSTPFTWNLITLVMGDGKNIMQVLDRILNDSSGTPLVDWSGSGGATAPYWFSSQILQGDGSGLTNVNAAQWLSNTGGNDGGFPFYSDSMTIATTPTIPNHVVIVGAGPVSSGPHGIAGGTGGLGSALLSAGGAADPAFGLIKRALTQNFADAGNTSTSETDLYSYTMPSATFTIPGQNIHANYGGIFVNSTSTKQLRVYFDTNLIFDSGALTTSTTSAWRIDLTCIMFNSANGRCVVSLNASGASLAAGTTYTTFTVTSWNSTKILKITGTAAGVGAATNDIVAKIGTVDFSPTGP